MSVRAEELPWYIRSMEEVDRRGLSRFLAGLRDARTRRVLRTLGELCLRAGGRLFVERFDEDRHMVCVLPREATLSVTYGGEGGFLHMVLPEADAVSFVSVPRDVGIRVETGERVDGFDVYAEPGRLGTPYGWLVRIRPLRLRR